MAARLEDAEVGDWFTSMPSGVSFEIVAIDREADSVAIQYFDGTLEEIDVASWPELEPRAVAPPEDWTGAFDATKEDLGGDPVPPLLSRSDVYDNLERLL